MIFTVKTMVSTSFMRMPEDGYCDDEHAPYSSEFNTEDLTGIQKQDTHNRDTAEDYGMLIYDDGIELNAVLEVPEDHDGHRLVILLHGFTSSKDRPHTIRTAAVMRDAGFATLRFDLYGHGESGGEFRKHTLFKWISNTMAVIDWARKQGFDELYLSGHSQGGLVAALVAGMEPDRIRGLVLRAPAFMIPQCARDGNMLGQEFDPDRIPDVVETIKGLELDGDYLRVAQIIHVEDATDRFKGPVLIVHGDRDDTVPVEDSRKYSERYKNCDLIVLPGETHHFDRHPDQMENLIRAWMIQRGRCLSA